MALSRRTLLLGGAVVVAGLGARAAFGGGGSVSSGATTLEFWGGPNADQRQDQVKAWSAKHPNSKVKFTEAGATGAGLQALRKFAAVVASGNAPHVVDFDRFQVATYANWNMFRPLDDYFKRDKY